MENEVIPEVSLASNRFIPDDLIALIRNRSDMELVKSRVRDTISALEQQASVHKRIQTWIKNNTYPNKIDEQRKQVDEYNSALSYYKVF